MFIVVFAKRFIITMNWGLMMDSPAVRFWEKLKKDGEVIFIIVLLAFYFYYLAYTTTLVPNTTYINDSETGKMIPQVRYLDNSLVPKQHVSYTQALIGALGVILLVWIIYMKHLNRSDIISELEAWRIIKKEIEFKRDVLKLPMLQGRLEFGPHVFLRHTQVSGQERRPWKYVMGAKVINQDDIETYLFIGIDPYTGMLRDILPSEMELQHFDTCARCGKYADIKYIDPTDYYKLVNAAKSGGSKPPGM